MKALTLTAILATVSVLAQETNWFLQSYPVAAIATPTAPPETRLALIGRVSSETVTNVVAGDNASGCLYCKQNGYGATLGAVLTSIPPQYHGFGYCAPYVAPTEKWVITNIFRRTTLSVDWGGDTLRHTKEVLLLSTTNRWKLNTTWTPEK